MSDGKKESGVGRRNFLKSAAIGAAAMAVEAPNSTVAQSDAPSNPARPAAAPEGNATAPRPSAEALARETGPVRPTAESIRVEHPGSDYMVDVIRTFDIEYVACNPGSNFDGLQESLINYGMNTKPEFIMCCHEESAGAMAHGYYKMSGKPMMTMYHGTVGLQHGAMGIYNAYCDRVPIFMIAGLDFEGPRPEHNATDLAAMVRSFVKWDAQPRSLQEYAVYAQRAFALAMTPPMAPVLLVLDSSLQKNPQPASGLRVPKFTVPTPPAGDINAVREAAAMLVAAQNPCIQTGIYARTQNGMDMLVELAELLQAPVSNGNGDRNNFPSRHPLAGEGAGAYDLTLMLEAVTNRNPAIASAATSNAKTIHISAEELLPTSNYDVNAFYLPYANLSVGGDAEATMPALIEEVKKLLTADRNKNFEIRGARHIAANRNARAQAIEKAQYGWDASPVSLARLAAELWPLIENEDWALASPQAFISYWPNSLWNMDRVYRYIGGQGGGGMGYGAPAAVGAALANKNLGRVTINIQTDGDLNYAPGVLWTAVHHRIPLLTIMHNNRGYHQEVMMLENVCGIRNRGENRNQIGTKLDNPFIDYATMAKAYGMASEGPIDNPRDLVPALKRGLAHVKKGEPYLIDLITQPR